MNWTAAKRTMRHAASAAILLPAFAAQAQAPAPAPKPAAAPAPDMQQFGDWQLGCQAPRPGAAEVCEMRQIARDDQKKPVAGIFLFNHVNGLAMRAHVPMGVLLRKNPTLQIDNGASTDGLSYLRCSGNICVARMSVAEAFLAAMRNGKEATLTFHATENKPIPVKFTLNGFASAEKALAERSR